MDTSSVNRPNYHHQLMISPRDLVTLSNKHHCKRILHLPHDRCFHASVFSPNTHLFNYCFPTHKIICQLPQTTCFWMTKFFKDAKRPTNKKRFRLFAYNSQCKRSSFSRRQLTTQAHMFLWRCASSCLPVNDLMCANFVIQTHTQSITYPLLRCLRTYVTFFFPPVKKYFIITLPTRNKLEQLNPTKTAGIHINIHMCLIKKLWKAVKINPISTVNLPIKTKPTFLNFHCTNRNHIYTSRS